MYWEQRESIVVQLRDFILQLRAFTPLHPGKIHAAGGLEFGLYDPRHQNKSFGPFETVDQFHKFTGVNYDNISTSIQHFSLPSKNVQSVLTAPSSVTATLAPHSPKRKGGLYY